MILIQLIQFSNLITSFVESEHNNLLAHNCSCPGSGWFGQAGGGAGGGAVGGEPVELVLPRI